MSRDRKIEICAINIAANPHPPGTYERLLQRASSLMTRARGHDFAKITKTTRDTREDVLHGRILVWTDIDLTAPWLDLEKEDILAAEDQEKINIPSNAKPNYRVFGFIFNVEKHRLYYESINEFGQTLGPSVARRIFDNLLHARGVLPEDTEVEVTVIPQEGAVRRILDMPGLRMLEVRLVLPNDDSIDPAKRERVHQRIRAMHAKRLEEKVVKQAGAARLEPDQELRDLAALAAENGFVRGEGRIGDVVEELSTVEAPRRERISIEAGRDLLARILATVGFF